MSVPILSLIGSFTGAPPNLKVRFAQGSDRNVEYDADYILDEYHEVLYEPLQPDHNGKPRSRYVRTKVLYLVKFTGYDCDFGHWDASPEGWTLVRYGDWCEATNIAPAILNAWELMKGGRVFPWMERPDFPYYSLVY
jgi:hypothetical protein